MTGYLAWCGDVSHYMASPKTFFAMELFCSRSLHVANVIPTMTMMLPMSTEESDVANASIDWAEKPSADPNANADNMYGNETSISAMTTPERHVAAKF